MRLYSDGLEALFSYLCWVVSTQAIVVFDEAESTWSYSNLCLVFLVNWQLAVQETATHKCPCCVVLFLYIDLQRTCICICAVFYNIVTPVAATMQLLFGIAMRVYSMHTVGYLE